jgi:hypothetical protein
MSVYSPSSSSTSTDTDMISVVKAVPTCTDSQKSLVVKAVSMKSMSPSTDIVAMKQLTLDESHRHSFNKSVFSCISTRDCYVFPEDNNKSQQFNTTQYNNIIATLQQWENDDKEVESNFRKNNHNGYHWFKQFTVVESTEPNKSNQFRLHRKENSGVGRMCLPMPEIYDAIKMLILVY